MGKGQIDLTASENPNTLMEWPGGSRISQHCQNASNWLDRIASHRDVKEDTKNGFAMSVKPIMEVIKEKEGRGLQW